MKFTTEVETEDTMSIGFESTRFQLVTGANNRAGVFENLSVVTSIVES